MPAPSGDFESIGVIIDDASGLVQSAIDKLDAVATGSLVGISNELASHQRDFAAAEGLFNGVQLPPNKIGNAALGLFPMDWPDFPVAPDLASPPNSPRELKGTPVQWDEPATLAELSPSFKDLTASLEARIDTGSNLGLPPWAEDAAYEQGRNTPDYLRQRHEAMHGYALFWADPPGLMMQDLNDLRLGKMDADATVNRQITAGQMRTMADNRVEAIRQGLAAEQQDFDYHERRQDRIVDILKYNLEYEFSLFNRKMSHFDSLMLIFKSQAEVLTDFYKSDTKGYENGQRFLAALGEIDIGSWQVKMKKERDSAAHTMATANAAVDAHVAVGLASNSMVETGGRAAAVALSAAYSALNFAEQIAAQATASGSANFNYTQSVSVNVD